MKFAFLLVLTLFLQVEAKIFTSFPKTLEEMQSGYETAKKKAQGEIEQILNIEANDRTFENTALAYDKAFADFEIFCSTMALMNYVHPNPEMRQEAEKLLLAATALHLFDSDCAVYEAFKSLPKVRYNSEREYYLQKAFDSFKRSGVLLSFEDREQMKQLQDRIAALSLQFRINIDDDETVLLLKEEEVACFEGQTFEMEGDAFIVPCNANTTMQIFKDCPFAAVRQKCFQAYRLRAFPQNLEVLKELIETKHKLALLLGYQNFAELDLSDQMAKTAEQVHTFLQDIADENNVKIQNNWKQIVQDLPESVELTPDGKVNPWDANYLLSAYAKKHYDLDSNKVAEFLPFQSTFEKLLEVFSVFFALEFQIVNETDLWDPSVITLEVKEGGTLIGHILFDLFPRKNKYTHACCCSIVPPIENEPALAVIIANCSHPDRFKFHDLKTLCHEFGHAMHAILGRSEMPSQAAYNTPIDFGEAPSQLLEEWCYDSDVLKKISRHPQTGESLPDFMIESLQKSRSFGDGGNIVTGGSGDHPSSLAQYALFSLKVHEGPGIDFMKLNEEVYQQSPQVIAYTDAPYYCSFGHLAGYASKYYCYGWSKQIALKMYDYIKSHGGSFDPAMGTRYREKVIGKGGSQDANELVADFLGS